LRQRRRSPERRGETPLRRRSMECDQARRQSGTAGAPTNQRDSIFDRVFRLTLALADRRPGLSVLLFHRVLDSPDPFRPGDLTAERFATVAGMLARNFCALPLEEGIERLRNNAL